MTTPFILRIEPPRLLLCMAAAILIGILPERSWAQNDDASNTAGRVVQIIAHRGASAQRPECTLAAIRRAIEVGATAVEVDVRTSKDGVLFVLHDATLDRTTNGKGSASQMTMEELRRLDAGSWFDPAYRNERIPTLREALKVCGGKTDVLLDLKERGAQYVQAVTNEVKQHGDPQQTIIGVRSVEQAKQFRKLLPRARQLGLIPNPENIEAFAQAGVETIRLWPRWIEKDGAPPVGRVRQTKAKLHLNGTTGNLEETLALLKHHPDSLSSDDPQRLLATLASLRSNRPVQYQWRTGPPVASPKDVAGISCYSIKDPSVVRYDNRWHLFCTIRGKERSHAVVYLSFADWRDADRAPRRLLTMHEGYFCAPQVFYFTPHGRWYLICQAANEDWTPNYQPAFAMTKKISDPTSWSPLRPLFGHEPASDEETGKTVRGKPDDARAWLDFWVICDEAKAHLFFTSLDGKMWRSETALKSFPHGWSAPAVALEGDVFEASHTYRLKNKHQYLTLIEAQNGHGWRYYKAYLADRLEGPWKPLAAAKDHAYASMKNVIHSSNRWTDAISHGELLRRGYNERLEVDPSRLRLLFQGVLDPQRRGKRYGEIPWRLGILEPVILEEEKQP